MKLEKRLSIRERKKICKLTGISMHRLTHGLRHGYLNPGPLRAALEKRAKLDKEKKEDE